MPDEAQVVHYHAAMSVVNIEGVATDSTDDDCRTVTEQTADVTLGTAADPKEPLVMVFEEHFGRDREFDIKLTADERLAGATATTKGAGAQILAAGLSLVPLIAKVAGTKADKPKPIDDAFKADCQKLAERREKMKAAIDNLQQAVAAEVCGPDQERPDLTRLKGLKAALALARAEAADIEAQFNAWRAKRYPSLSRKLSYSFSVDDLPCLPRAKKKVTFGSDELTKIQEAADELGLIVARIENEPSVTKHPRTDTELLFRRPRPVRLAIYERIDPDKPLDFRLKSLRPASIIDSRSAWGRIAVRSGLFEEHGTAADFGQEGTLVRISNKDVGAAGTIASALSGAGSRIKDALEQGTAIAAAFAPGPDSDLKSLQDKVTRHELEARDAKAIREIAGVTDGKI